MDFVSTVTDKSEAAYHQVSRRIQLSIIVWPQNDSVGKAFTVTIVTKQYDMISTKWRWR